MSTPDTPRPARGPRALRAAPIAKAAGVAALLLGFMLALAEVAGLVRERDGMRDVARAAVGRLWGPAQTVTGPFLLLPERRVRGTGFEMRTETAYRVVAPRDLEATVALEPETRRRGLYDVPVYTATVSMSGRFDPEDLAASRPADAPAALAVAVDDAARVVGTPEASWAGAPVAVRPELPASARAALGPQAVAARLSPPAALAEGGRFTVTLRLRGTGQLLLAPSGRAATVAMRSPWPHPGFIGSRTADDHEIGPEGFRATWRVSPFGRGLPAAWVAGEEEAGPDGTAPLQAIRGAAFGVALVQPVDPYRMTERALKYGMLFALYTVGAFVLLETVFRRPLHWIHYGLTGASVATFFLLLLSLSELIGFAPAYALGAAGVVAQTGLYARSAIGDRRLALGFATLLAALYGGLFLLLRLEDAALVTGSLALFAAIGAAMMLTRRLGGRPGTAAG